ncbi:hypothetical protein BKA65DRAFT_554771 [Rhexocercosporidium sp. MPI-PUGE-AT-0058]|nr:hypothetical protein BKA65DRAFT_554771 [Rhexocercosporidium sp. MPI-PUGE-AT-0058]
MHLRLALSTLLSFYISRGCSHFVLQIPTSLGYDDVNEATAPCDTFNPTDRSGTITNWTVGGYPVSVISTHSSVTWEYRVAKVSSPTVWTSLTPILTQTGTGHFCEPQIPGLGSASWLGVPAVFQVIQHAPDGALYQCAAIVFVAGGPTAKPAGCTNSTGIAAHW